MNNLESGEDFRKTAKNYAVACTIVYIILFPWFFYVALLSVMLLENPKTTVPVGLSMMFVMFWIPLSMPVAIYLMWSNFSRHKYNKTFLFGLLPLFTLVVVFLLVEGIGRVFAC